MQLKRPWMLKSSLILGFTDFLLESTLSQKTVDWQFISITINETPWKWNETQQNSFRNAQIFIHSVTTDETPKIQIWLVIELTDSESFIFFFFCLPEANSDRKEEPGFNTQGKLCRNPFHLAYNQTILLSYKPITTKFKFETHLPQFFPLLADLAQGLKYSVSATKLSVYVVLFGCSKFPDIHYHWTV